MSEEATRTDTAEERPEQTEERTAPSDGTLSSGQLSFDERVQEVRELRESVREGEAGSTFLFDEAGATGGRRERAAAGEDFALRMGFNSERKTSTTLTGTTQGTSSIGDPLDFTRKVSNRELEKKLHAYGRRLKRVEEKIDDVLDAVDREQRPVGEVLQDLVDDEIGVRQAAYELDWSHQKVRNVMHEIEREDLDVE